MKVLVLSSGFPYPVDAGRKVVLAGFLQFAVSMFGAANVTLVCLSSDTAEQQHAQLCPSSVVFLPTAGLLRRAVKVAWESLLLRRHAIQEMILYSPIADRHIKSLISDIAPDIILVDTIRLAQYAGAGVSGSRRVILYLDDLYSLRYMRTVDAMAQFPDAAIDAVGTFHRFLPKRLRILARRRGLQRALLNIESRILQKRERQMPALFDQVLLLNNLEVNLLARETGASNIAMVRPLLHSNGSRPRHTASREARYLFVGNLQYGPNAYALSLFLKCAMARAVAAIPGCRLVVVGRGASEPLKRLGARFGGAVRFMDYVSDLDQLMDGCVAMIVPLKFGTGIKIKVLEALRAGMPIVSTSCGVEGLGLTDGMECFVTDDLEEFVVPMKRLLEPELNRKISKNSHEFFARTFSPTVVSDEYRKIFFEDSVTSRRTDRESTDIQCHAHQLSA